MLKKWSFVAALKRAKIRLLLLAMLSPFVGGGLGAIFAAGDAELTLGNLTWLTDLMFLFLLAALVLCIFVLVILSIFRRSAALLAWLVYCISGSLFILAFVNVSDSVSIRIYDSRAFEVITYLDDSILITERWRTVHGDYPESFPFPAKTHETLPYLLRKEGRFHYLNRNDHFELVISGLGVETYQYDSRIRTWKKCYEGYCPEELHVVKGAERPDGSE